MPSIKDSIKRVLAQNQIFVRKYCHLGRGVDLAVDLQRTFDISSFDVVFDVGANVGQTTEEFVEIFANARIYSFEPVKETYDLLAKRFVGHARVFPHQFALGEDDHQVTIQLQEHSYLNSLSANQNIKDGQEKTELIQVRTMDQFAEANKIEKIDFLKLDVEGYELQVLRGGKKLLCNGAISFVFAEVGFSSKDFVHTNFNDLTTFLADYDFELFALFDQYLDKQNKRLLFANALFRHDNLRD